MNRKELEEECLALRAEVRELNEVVDNWKDVAVKWRERFDAERRNNVRTPIIVRRIANPCEALRRNNHTPDAAQAIVDWVIAHKGQALFNGGTLIVSAGGRWQDVHIGDWVVHEDGTFRIFNVNEFGSFYERVTNDQ